MTSANAAFYVAWLLVGGYVISNKLLVRKILAEGGPQADAYQEASSFQRSRIVMSVVFGGSQLTPVLSQSVSTQARISFVFFQLFIAAFLVFISLIFLA